MFNFVVCRSEPYFDDELDQTMRKVSRVLQVFETEAEANAACDLFGRFEDDIRVVHVEWLDEPFR